MRTNASTLSKLDLRQFTGDLQRFRHGFNPQVIYTPGIQHLAEAGGAYWLIDVIASYLTPKFVAQAAKQDPRVADMQFWRLTVGEDRSAVVEARADSPCEPFVRQEIEFTDFPLDSVDVWTAWDGTYWTLYLPSEH